MHHKEIIFFSDFHTFDLFFSVSDLFVGDSWRLHPDWVYCEYKYAGALDDGNAEENMKQFFDKMQQPDWNPNGLPKQKCKDKQKFDPNCFKCKFPF